MGLYEDLMMGIDDTVDAEFNKKIIKAPFAWLGGKTYLADKLNSIMPHRKKYVEVFGGSGITLLKRSPSEVEVFNDRNSGITDFYLTLQEDSQFIVDEINKLLCGKEMFYYYLRTWDKISDRKKRAVAWYYVIRTSWGGKMKYFGLEKDKDVTRRLYSNLPFFTEIHRRLRNVVIENHDYKALMNYYDSIDAVFYCDPPYINCGKNDNDYYEHNINHTEFLQTVFDMKGFVVVSNFESTEYLACDWDEVISVSQRYSMHKDGRIGNERKEMVYIKYEEGAHTGDTEMSVW